MTSGEVEPEFSKVDWLTMERHVSTESLVMKKSSLSVTIQLPTPEPKSPRRITSSKDVDHVDQGIFKAPLLKKNHSTISDVLTVAGVASTNLTIIPSPVHIQHTLSMVPNKWVHPLLNHGFIWFLRGV